LSSQARPHLTGGALATLLAGLAMLGPFSVSTYLPAFPQIRLSLHASDLAVQQTLSAFLISSGIMMLWYGALADAFGRRKVILINLLVFLLASIGCALANSIETLWMFRVLQGISSGAGTVLGSAIIRDLYQGATAARLVALVGMVFALGPGVAPIIGGWIVKLSDWRSIFIFVSGYALILLLVCYRFLPESLPAAQRTQFHPLTLLNGYFQIFRNVPFLLKAGALSFNFCGMFLYVAASPVFIRQHLQLGPEQFGWQFIPMVSGIFLGSLLSNRIAGKLSVPRQIMVGYGIAIAAAALNVLYHLFFVAAIPWSVLPIFFYAFGVSIVGPGIMLLLLELIPSLRGTLSSCHAFLLTMLASITSGLIAPMIASHITWLAAGQLSFGILGLSCWLLAYRSRSRS
jgi:DHA1 family bicyclomycin/chloramphenicol resistance-like MFS transporter